MLDSLAGEIAHPVEFILNFLLPTVLPPLLAGLFHGVHVVTLWFWFFFRSLRSTEAHSGYILPWYTNIVKIELFFLLIQNVLK
jgi:sterol desaturase/sphingolipid hydroxylase (fatty acid hydroxylase superfamily)